MAVVRFFAAKPCGALAGNPIVEIGARWVNGFLAALDTIISRIYGANGELPKHARMP